MLLTTTPATDPKTPGPEAWVLTKITLLISGIQTWLCLAPSSLFSTPLPGRTWSKGERLKLAAGVGRSLTSEGHVDPVSTAGRRRMSILPGLSSSRFLRFCGPGTENPQDQAPPAVLRAAGCGCWLTLEVGVGRSVVYQLQVLPDPLVVEGRGRKIYQLQYFTAALHTRQETQAEVSTPAPGRLGFEDKLSFVLLT